MKISHPPLIIHRFQIEHIEGQVLQSHMALLSPITRITLAVPSRDLLPYTARLHPAQAE